MRTTICAFIAAACVLFAQQAAAQDKLIVVASTTSTKDTGLFDHLLPLFTQKTGIAVVVMAVGTGQALDAARRGNADVLLVHYKTAELQFVAEGHGVKRHPVMYNDYVLVGPTEDPAEVGGSTDVAAAFASIRDTQAPFISRGDHSGTHLTELMLWNKDVGIDIQKETAKWYRTAARGMKATLHMARATGGYTLTDRGTWQSFTSGGDLKIMVEGDRRMFNQYSAILVNPEKHPHVKKELGQMFIDWLISAEGQRAIAVFRIEGQPVFIPNAGDPDA
ncbi:MAG: substrate-binding domain-containing protein [Xanthobacteraceae bacterium]|nr:substrate-binding domain-containing protein [Xanthobacteraceae bacterium]